MGFLIAVALAGSAAIAQAETAPTPNHPEKRGAPAHAKPLHPRLKVGAPVAFTQCQGDPNKCLCPKNSKGIRYRGGGPRYEYQYVCVSTACPSGSTPRTRPNRSGVIEGYCVGGGS
jgi:hypothetical protein